MNKTISRYLQRNILYTKLIDKSPHDSLGIIVVIPCHNEPDVTSSIQSLAACDPPDCRVEVIVSINAGVHHPEHIKSQNHNSRREIEGLQQKWPHWMDVYALIHNELPKKKAGVGLGRKIGMDEAVRRFMQLDRDRGIIVCYDADSECSKNYFTELEKHFQQPSVGSASIHYEHPVTGDQFSNDIYAAIIQYELHLRYFIKMQKELKLPYAFHTIGSSMACTVAAYCAVGGMNQRKAGEDFYFIHKLVKYGRHTELNTTKVIPSPRVSDRVPFGTGKAIGTIQAMEQKTFKTYCPQSFYDLQDLVHDLPHIYDSERFSDHLSDGLLEFLQHIDAEHELSRIFENTTDYSSFEKMFWQWFDAFVLMKYLHFVRELCMADIPVLQAVNQVNTISFSTPLDALIYYRQKDTLL